MIGDNQTFTGFPSTKTRGTLEPLLPLSAGLTRGGIPSTVVGVPLLELCGHRFLLLVHETRHSVKKMFG